MNRITSLQHPLVKHLVKLREDRSYRYENKTVLIEGHKLISEIPVKRILTTNYVPPHASADEIILVSEAIIQKISSMKNPEGIVAEVAMPSQASWTTLSRLIVLDGISDPGNLGTLLRTALAFGWEGAFLLEECCDPYNDKALTAARGATFRLPLAQGTWNDLQPLKEKHKLQSFVADTHGQPLEKADVSKLLLVLGNESHGPSEATLAHCTQITIPMTTHMESLNVAIAGGILMYTLRKKS